jgi:cysteinyl-tRNA synthetase
VRSIRLHDSKSGQLVALEPREPGKVGIYACGPTVYNRIHVGNARPFVVFSLLKRFLEHEGYAVTLVANVTDVNDKIYAAAAQRGIPSDELAREMTAHYVADTDALRLGRPDFEPTVTEMVGEIIDLVQALLDRGAAYVAGGDVLFRVRADPAYGSLSHRDVDQMDQGEGVEGAEHKEDPLDFALWKATKPGEDTAWDAPWGRGRPAWHIECSAMAEKLLGLGFEIHGGGNDLTFPHHENEAAQTRMGRGAELARIWMHSGMLQTGGEKMAKSVGNIERLPEALERWGRDALILLFVAGHPRGPLEYSDASLEQATAGARRIREAGRRLVPGPSPAWSAPRKEAFLDALADDFATPRALAEVFGWVADANRSAEPVGDADLREMLWILGLDGLLDADAGKGPGDDALALLAARDAARAARDWAEADRLRDALRAAGWEVRDGPAGAELVPA